VKKNSPSSVGRDKNFREILRCTKAQ